MDTEKARALLCAIEEGSLTAVSERLGYTISGISRMMASLEDETGFPLLVRSRSGVVPTAECRQLLPLLKDIVMLADNYEQTAADMRGLAQGSLTVGTSYYAYYDLFAKLIADFESEYPGIDIEIKDGTSSEMMSALEEGLVDFCIISKRPGGHEWMPLFSDELLACVPEGHPAAERKKFPVKRFAEDGFIEIYPGKETDNSRMLKERGIRPKVAYSTSDNFAAYSMVRAGLGVTCFNALIAEAFPDGVVYLPLDPPGMVEIGIALPKGMRRSPAAERFASFVKERFSSR